MFRPLTRSACPAGTGSSPVRCRSGLDRSQKAIPPTTASANSMRTTRFMPFLRDEKGGLHARLNLIRREGKRSLLDAEGLVAAAACLGHVLEGRGEGRQILRVDLRLLDVSRPIVEALAELRLLL